MKRFLLKLLVLFAVHCVYSLSPVNIALRECSNDYISVILQVSSSVSTTGCSEINSNGTEQWECSDLQAAMEAIGAVAQVGRSIFGSGSTASLLGLSPDCAVLVVPSGVHYITAPVYFGNTSVHLIGTNDTSTIHCNYSLDVNKERVFEPDYEYPDYVMYFNRSASVGFEGVEFIGCPYPFRVDTVSRVSVENSRFR